MVRGRLCDNMMPVRLGYILLSFLDDHPATSIDVAIFDQQRWRRRDVCSEVLRDKRAFCCTPASGWSLSLGTLLIDFSGLRIVPRV